MQLLESSSPLAAPLTTQVDELKKRSEDTKRALEVQRRQEEEQQRRLRELQEVQQSKQQQFASLQEQAAYYSAQIKSQYELYKLRQQELEDMRVSAWACPACYTGPATLLQSACACSMLWHAPSGYCHASG